MERGGDGKPASGSLITNNVQTNAKHQIAIRATQLLSGPFAGAGPEAELLREAGRVFWSCQRQLALLRLWSVS